MCERAISLVFRVIRGINFCRAETRQPVIYQRQTELQTVQRATFYLVTLSSTSILNLSKRQNRALRSINTCYQFATLSIREQEGKDTTIGPCGEKLAKEMNIRAHARSLSCIRLLVTPWTVARQVPLSMKLSRQRILEQVAIVSSRGSSRPRN